MSWALRKSSKVCRALATARRCRVGRAPCGRVGPSLSVLVIVAPVYGVPVPVVQVVDVVAVRDRRVTALLAVLVTVVLRDGGVRVAERERVRPGPRTARTAGNAAAASTPTG